MRKVAVLIGVILLGLAFSRSAMAGFVFSGSGAGPAGGTVAASVDFSVSGSNLDIILTNTTPGGSAIKGNTLTGLIFDIADPGVTLGIPNSLPIFRNGSDIFVYDNNGTNSKSDDKIVIDNNALLAGSWTAHMAANTPAGRYGVATSGLSGLFMGGTITRGNSNDDYGIVAANAFVNGQSPPQGGGFNDKAFPLVQDSLHFVLPITQGILDGGDFKNVRFAFGTAGDTITAVPEPGSLAVWGLLLVGGAVMYRRYRAKRA
jgi:hypothetical protein